MRHSARPVLIGVGVATALLSAAVIGLAWSTRGDRSVDRATITATSIVMLGDSITEEGPWSSSFGDRQIANRGYAGYTTAQLVDVARDVASARPTTVYVLTGTNDIRDGHPPSWTVEHLTQILDEFARSAPETDVVVQTVLPRADHVDDVIAANVAITDLAEERGLPVLDLYTAFDDGDGGLRPEDTDDGLHLSERGNERWAGLLEDVFERS